ncbi:hypothetical protein UlMin_016214, partial [Ulmus minor]
IDAMDPDWRTELQPPDLRQRIIIMTVEMLKHHVWSPGEKGEYNLQKLAELVEEKIYTTSKTSDEYITGVYRKLQSMDVTGRFRASSSSSSLPMGHVQSIQEPDWQEDIHEKIKSLKELYMPDLVKMSEKLTGVLRRL